MKDESYLDKKYFIDGYVFNCPFCNRNNLQYSLTTHFSFDWTKEKKCYGYLAKCSSCDHESMHLSFKYLCNQSHVRFDDIKNIDS